MKKRNIVLLIIFISLAVYLNFMPHLSYKYPLHVDEWVHFQYSNHLSDNSPLYFGESYKNNLESGFHFLLATLNSLSISYLFMFNFFPALFTLFICLGVFVLTRRLFNETSAVFSVLFIALLKSTVMILGPVFLVPMALGLFLIAIGLFLIKIESKSWFLILAFLLIAHPPSAMAFFLLINIEFLIKKDYVKNLKFQFLGILIAIPIYISIFLEKGIGTIDYLAFEPMLGLIFIPNYLTWFVTIICITGIYFSLEKKNYSISFYSLALLFFIILFYYFKLEFFIPYRRALMYLFLIFSIAFGVGFSGLVSLFSNKKLKIIIFIMLLAAILICTVPIKLKSNGYFYQIINDKEFKAFQFIKNNTAEDATAVLDPWKAIAFTPIAERKVYSRIPQGPNEIYAQKNNEIASFFNDKCKNMDFLKQNNITIIYGICENNKLKNIYENVYVVG